MNRIARVVLYPVNAVRATSIDMMREGECKWGASWNVPSVRFMGKCNRSSNFLPNTRTRRAVRARTNSRQVYPSTLQKTTTR